jgi:hypothetical protein
VRKKSQRDLKTELEARQYAYSADVNDQLADLDQKIAQIQSSLSSKLQESGSSTKDTQHLQ